MDKIGQPLNPKQKKFVAEYLIDLNATQAAVRAGYSPRTAEVQGHMLLRNPRLAAFLRESRLKLEVTSDITQTRVLAELALLAFSDVSHYKVDEIGLNVELAEGAPKHAMRAVASIKRKTFITKDGDTSREVEIKLWDKPGPLKLAGRHVGLFPDKIEISSKDDRPIAIIVNGVMPLPPELAGVAEAAIGENTTTTLKENGS